MSTPATDEPVAILLVDDRPDNLAVLEGILRRTNYKLVLASNGRDALRYLLHATPAVILLDVAMPDLDGFETANFIKARERTRQIPIVFLTASVYELDIFRQFPSGDVDYLRKPLDSDEVRARVALYVRLYEQRKLIELQAAQLRELERERAELLQIIELGYPIERPNALRTLRGGKP